MESKESSVVKATPEILMQMAEEHLPYEINMFDITRKVVLRQNRAEDDSAQDAVIRSVQNAVIESAAIHIRALLKFFFGSPIKDDVVAGHFFPSFEDWRLCQRELDKPELRKVLEDRANKEVAHLTMTRTTKIGTDKSWERPWQLAESILKPTIITFLERIPRNFLSPELGRILIRLKGVRTSS